MLFWVFCLEPVLVPIKSPTRPWRGRVLFIVYLLCWIHSSHGRNHGEVLECRLGCNHEIRKSEDDMAKTHTVFFWFYYHNLTYTNSSITKKMIWLWVNSYFYTIWMWVIHIHLFTSYDLGFTQLGTRVPSPHPLGMITILGEPRPIRWPTRTFHCGTLRDGRGCRNWAILMLQGRFFS